MEQCWVVQNSVEYQWDNECMKYLQVSSFIKSQIFVIVFAVCRIVCAVQYDCLGVLSSVTVLLYCITLLLHFHDMAIQTVRSCVQYYLSQARNK